MANDMIDEEREAYASLADEMNDGADWDESMWDADAVAAGKQYAEKHGLRWPPRMADFDRFYEWQNGGRHPKNQES